MRLAIDGTSLRADERGMGRIVRETIAALAAHPGVHVTVLANERADALRLPPDVTAARVAAGGDRARFDVVWFPWNAMRFRPAAPAVVSINDDFAFAYPAAGAVARWREQRPIRRAVRAAARIVTISQWSRRQLATRFALAPAAINVVPIAPAPFFAPGGEPSPLPDLRYVVAVGGGETRKNVPFLIDAMAAAFPAGDVTLALAGSLDAAAIAAIAATVLPVVRLGRVDDARLRALYRNARAVAVPSLAEGYGLVAAEAQACGAAVIASSTTALPEAVGDAGFTADPADRDAWIATLRRVVGDDGLNADLRARALARWSHVARTATADALLEIFRAVRR